MRKNEKETIKNGKNIEDGLDLEVSRRFRFFLSSKTFK